jgi:hypothetical protein
MAAADKRLQPRSFLITLIARVETGIHDVAPRTQTARSRISGPNLVPIWIDLANRTRKLIANF